MGFIFCGEELELSSLSSRSGPKTMERCVFIESSSLFQHRLFCCVRWKRRAVTTQGFTRFNTERRFCVVIRFKEFQRFFLSYDFDWKYLHKMWSVGGKALFTSTDILIVRKSRDGRRRDVNGGGGRKKSEWMNGDITTHEDDEKITLWNIEGAGSESEKLSGNSRRRRHKQWRFWDSLFTTALLLWVTNLRQMRRDKLRTTLITITEVKE